MVPIVLLLLLVALIGGAILYTKRRDKKNAQQALQTAPVKQQADIFTWRSSRPKPANVGLGITNHSFFSRGDMGIGTWGADEGSSSTEPTTSTNPIPTIPE